MNSVRDTDYGNFRDFDRVSIFDGISWECEHDIPEEYSKQYKEFFAEFCAEMANRWYNTEEWSCSDWDAWREVVEEHI